MRNLKGIVGAVLCAAIASSSLTLTSFAAEVSVSELEAIAAHRTAPTMPFKFLIK